MSFRSINCTGITAAPFARAGNGNGRVSEESLNEKITLDDRAMDGNGEQETRELSGEALMFLVFLGGFIAGVVLTVVVEVFIYLAIQMTGEHV